MPQSLANVVIHLIFSTKNRDRILMDSFRDEFHKVMGRLFVTMDCHPLIINSVEDHVHCLFVLSRSRTLASVVSKLKTGSGDWLRKSQPHLTEFHWQSGYGAFSVSQSRIDNVSDYIRDQRKHHTTLSFQEEFRKWLQKHNIVYDEKYVWD
jgi:putative transposase